MLLNEITKSMVDTVLKRLRNIASINDAEISDEHAANMERDIAAKEKQGWTADEIVSIMKWIEDVNPHVGENEALANMRKAEAKVKERLAGK